VLAACYSPKAKPGAQCASTGDCPSGLVCAATGTCELTDVDAPRVIDTPLSDATIDGAALAPPNDKPGGAIDISGGGNFTDDLTYATNDAATNGTPVCGAAAARDVFYKVSTPKAVVLYVDTFGSDFDTVVRVFPGACVAGVFAPGTVCHNDQCGTPQTQFVGGIATGDNCIVVAEKTPATTPAHLMMHVEVAGWNGQALPVGVNQVSNGTTAASNDDTVGSCAGGTGGRDRAYYFAGCPGVTLTLDATTCSAATAYDTVLYVLGPGTTELACNDDDAACSVMPTASRLSAVHAVGAHLFWVVIDGTLSTDNGAYSLTTTLQ
jgi:hypothetical protein